MTQLLGKKLTESEMHSLVLGKLNWILNHSHPVAVYLFGSAHRKTMTTGSDIDLLLIFETDELIAQAKLKLAKNRPAEDWPHDLLFCTKSHFDAQVDRRGSIYNEACYFGEILFGGDKK